MNLKGAVLKFLILKLLLILMASGAVGANNTNSEKLSLLELQALEARLVQAVDLARGATVGIRAPRDRSSWLTESRGSGVLVSRDGLVLTAAHVFEKLGRRVEVHFADGRVVSGRAIGFDARRDMGIIQLSEPGPYPWLEMAATKPKPGEWCIAMGHPGGVRSDRGSTARLGRVISSRGEFLRTDATIVSGDSGGPLLNIKGEVIGIHSRIYSRLSSNFHIPVTTFKRHWRSLNGTGEGVRPEITSLVGAKPNRPCLGVLGRTIASGCLVEEVYAKLGAAKVGLKPGDMIEQFNGKQISTVLELGESIARRKVNDVVSIVVNRSGKQIRFEVKLTAWPSTQEKR